MSDRNRTIVLVLDNLRSVYNVASLFRTADCFGISKIYVCGTTPAPIDRFGRIREDFKKVSLGAEHTVAWEYWNSTIDAIASLKKSGYCVGALEQLQDSVMLHCYTPTDTNYALVLGAEVVGVDPAVLELVDTVWEIEQFGAKESLNVCMAGAIGMYHLRFASC